MALLVPDLKIVTVTLLASMFAAADFKGTITLGSILTAAAVIVVGGLFTLRNNLKTFWKERCVELEEKIRVMEQHAEQKLGERAAFAEEQRELRHQLKNELAVATGKLEVELAKHDLNALYSRFDVLEDTLNTRAHLFEWLIEQSKRQDDALEHILEALRHPTE